MRLTQITTQTCWSYCDVRLDQFVLSVLRLDADLVIQQRKTKTVLWFLLWAAWAVQDAVSRLLTGYFITFRLLSHTQNR